MLSVNPLSASCSCAAKLGGCQDVWTARPSQPIRSNIRSSKDIFSQYFTQHVPSSSYPFCVKTLTLTTFINVVLYHDIGLYSCLPLVLLLDRIMYRYLNLSEPYLIYGSHTQWVLNVSTESFSINFDILGKMQKWDTRSGKMFLLMGGCWNYGWAAHMSDIHPS